MNPWNPTHSQGQQWVYPSVVSQLRPPFTASLQRHPPPAPPTQRPPPTLVPSQQIPIASHSQRAVYSAPPHISPTAQSQSQASRMATEAPRITQDNPLREFAALVAAALRDHERRTSERLENIEIVVGGLSKATTEVIGLVKAAAAHEETKNSADRAAGPTQQEMKDASTGLQNLIAQATRAILSKTERIESMLGDPSAPDYDNSKRTVFGRIDSLEQAFLELSETVSDPEAARPATVRHEAAVNTSPPPRTTADVGIDALDAPSPLQLPQRLLPVAEVGVQAEGPTLVDAETATSTEVPRRLSTESGTVCAPSPTTSRAAPFFPRTFTLQPLTPAQWTASEEDSESSSSDFSCRQLPDAPHGEPDRSRVPTSTSERFGSSIYDEQEIDDHLGDGAGNAVLSSEAPTQRDSTLSPLATPPIVLPRIIISPVLVPSDPMTAPMMEPIQPNPLQTPAPSSSPSLRPSVPSSPVANGNPVSAPSTCGTYSPAAASLSSLSSAPSSSPLLSPQQTEQSRSAPLRPQVERTLSFSSLSSLSTLGSNNSNPSESASVSAPPRVKTERTENGPWGRPAKRRKTLANAGDIHPNTGSASTSTKRGRGSSATRGGRGKGRGRRKSRQLLITPVKEPAPPPVPSEPRQRYEAPRIGTDCPWPRKVSGDDHREFVACDYCEGWYHFGCVGLTKGDPRLEPDAQFICPPCNSSSDIREQRCSVRFQEAACLRPDCDRPGAAEDTNEYFVERIIGRRPYRAEVDVEVTEPTEFMWLVKWDGWKADQATWAANEHLGECSRIIEEFEQAAEIEGRDLANQDATILLNEAAAVGWGAVRF